ncbi:MAG: nitronate monooxygenase [Thermoleophilia bacterium]|nr:nitronate monooxygenase [Thermoleophilia bacterium]
MPRTALCSQLGVEHPILSVGFGAGAGPELVAAVSNAGGLGVLGVSTLPPDEIRARVHRTRELTDRPFGANVILAGLEHPQAAPLVEERIATCIEERVPALVFFWGDPSPFVEPAHRHGVQVLIQVGSVEEARTAAAAAVDAVIAQGAEAGGHVSSRTALSVLVPLVVDAISPTPVLASGGIADGRGLAAALALGAQGVSLGTRFVASDEAFAVGEYKRRLVASGPEDTVYGQVFDGGWPDAPHRALRNRTVEEWEAAGRPPAGERPGEGTTIGTLDERWRQREIARYASFMLTPDFAGELEHAPMWAGQSVGLVRDVKPAGEIVRELAREADEVIARLCR